MRASEATGETATRQIPGSLKCTPIGNRKLKVTHPQRMQTHSHLRIVITSALGLGARNLFFVGKGKKQIPVRWNRQKRRSLLRLVITTPCSGRRRSRDDKHRSGKAARPDSKSAPALANRSALPDNKFHSLHLLEQTDTLCHHHAEHFCAPSAVPRWC